MQVRSLVGGLQVPWRRRWQRIPVFLPRKSHGQRSLVGCSSWGCKEQLDWAYAHTHSQPGATITTLFLGLSPTPVVARFGPGRDSLWFGTLGPLWVFSVDGHCSRSKEARVPRQEAAQRTERVDGWTGPRTRGLSAGLPALLESSAPGVSFSGNWVSFLTYKNLSSITCVCSSPND